LIDPAGWKVFTIDGPVEENQVEVVRADPTVVIVVS